MKILAIRGENLASLSGKFELDFTLPPLANSGIFAITGSTGAGKSTILDALCLALYDNSPRMNKASESINMQDVGENTISHKDCRNILRKGTGHGFAEVEFKALNGDTYRSTWRVWRARQQAEGALQPSTMSLYNLTLEQEESDTKTKTLDRIVELVGLNFDQFTRAVLLAQGDFATFLKAKESEKAELLEKLTGTQIYSKISQGIYSKAQEAKKKLDDVNLLLNEIKLLSEEELTALTHNKKAYEVKTKQQGELLKQTEREIDWLKKYKELKNSQEEVQKELTQIKEKIKESEPRATLLQRVNLAQEIRDSYIQHANEQKKIKESTLAIEENTKQHQTVEKQLHLLRNSFSLVQKSYQEQEKKIEALKPQLNEAKALDEQLKASNTRSLEFKKEVEELLKKQTEEEKLQQKRREKSKANKEETQKITAWFATYKNAEQLIPQLEVSIAHITQANQLNQERTATHKLLKEDEVTLQQTTEALHLFEKEMEKLNEMLPAEVLLLREKLERGKPCPVCGSTHHPHKENAQQKPQMNEEKLTKEREQLEKSIENRKKRIELLNKSVVTHTTKLERAEVELKSSLSKIEQLVASSVPNWRELYDKNTLIAALQKFNSLWREKSEKLTQLEKERDELRINLENGLKTAKELSEQLAGKQEFQKTHLTKEAELIRKRKELLGGKAAKEVEELEENLLKQLHKQQLEEQKKVAESEQKIAKLRGSKEELERLLKESVVQEQKLSNAISAWLETHKEELDTTPLELLMEKSSSWIKKEQEYLQELNKQHTTASTKLTERSEQLKKHELSPHKPKAESSTLSSLEEQEQLLATELKEMSEALNAIEVKLKQQEEQLGRQKELKKECDKRFKTNDNWQKLNVLLGSAAGDKFKKIAQGYTLDILLDHANKHLEQLNPRYQLEKINESLALQVIDNDALGEARPVHTLSGGESFLVSLALALGLSALSTNRMKIESLFIDEGFGSLDSDTLSIAMAALENLQTQGRRIGVISHVDAMMEKIPTQVQVHKLSNGRSEVRVVSN